MEYIRLLIVDEDPVIDAGLRGTPESQLRSDVVAETMELTGQLLPPG